MGFGTSASTSTGAQATRLEALLRLSAELAQQRGKLLRVTLDSIGDAVITTDADGAGQWLNPVAERMTGWLTRGCGRR